MAEKEPQGSVLSPAVSGRPRAQVSQGGGFPEAAPCRVWPSTP